MTVRTYTETDLKRCQEIAATEYDFNEYLTLPNFHFVVAQSDQATVTGYGVIQVWDWNRSAWIVDIIVDPAFRTQGYGRGLVTNLAEIARGKNCSVLIDYLPADFEFVFFYLKMGFKFCGYNSRLFYHANTEKRMAIIMGLDL
jgi:ribosomal protein S18 acetylase RimI-like enzyme